MARKKSGSELSINDLEKLLKSRRSQIGKLEKKRAKVSRQLQDIEADILSLGGALARHGRVARNTQSLSEVIHQVLKDKGGATMRVADIVDASIRAGYQTKSDNFRSIVNQTLIKDKRFAKSGVRGMYVLKK